MVLVGFHFYEDVKACSASEGHLEM